MVSPLSPLPTHNKEESDYIYTKPTPKKRTALHCKAQKRVRGVGVRFFF